MKIVDLICSKGMTGFYFDDQRAIKCDACHEGLTYIGNPITPGFSAIRQAGESISVILILEDGQIAYGDCAAVQYSGAGGRDPLFLADNFIPIIEKLVRPVLVGQDLLSFKDLAKSVDNLYEYKGHKIHTAIRYGVTQAILDAVAKANRCLMAEVIEKEYNTSISEKPIHIFTQCGDDRYNNVDKMIIKMSDVLPHGLINNVHEKLGEDGELLLEYIKWLKDRIYKLRPYEGYMPILHIDVYGTIGNAFNNDFNKIIQYFEKLEETAYPFKLRVEGPVDEDEREAQMLALKMLREMIDNKGLSIEIVADEWCNTLEDIKYFADNKAGHMIQIKTPDLGGINNIIEANLYCKEKGIGAYQGGTSNETDRSSQICVHIAMATNPEQILAKPGMGVDEGYMITYNEMQRILALRGRKRI